MLQLDTARHNDMPRCAVLSQSLRLSIVHLSNQCACVDVTAYRRDYSSYNVSDDAVFLSCYRVSQQERFKHWYASLSSSSSIAECCPLACLCAALKLHTLLQGLALAVFCQLL